MCLVLGLCFVVLFVYSCCRLNRRELENLTAGNLVFRTSQNVSPFCHDVSLVQTRYLACVTISPSMYSLYGVGVLVLMLLVDSRIRISDYFRFE